MYLEIIKDKKNPGKTPGVLFKSPEGKLYFLDRGDMFYSYDLTHLVGKVISEVVLVKDLEKFGIVKFSDTVVWDVEETKYNPYNLVIEVLGAPEGEGLDIFTKVRKRKTESNSFFSLNKGKWVHSQYLTDEVEEGWLPSTSRTKVLVSKIKEIVESQLLAVDGEYFGETTTFHKDYPGYVVDSRHYVTYWSNHNDTVSASVKLVPDIEWFRGALSLKSHIEGLKSDAIRDYLDKWISDKYQVAGLDELHLSEEFTALAKEASGYFIGASGDWVYTNSYGGDSTDGFRRTTVKYENINVDALTVFKSVHSEVYAEAEVNTPDITVYIGKLDDIISSYTKIVELYDFTGFVVENDIEVHSLSIDTKSLSRDEYVANYASKAPISKEIIHTLESIKEEVLVDIFQEKTREEYLEEIQKYGYPFSSEEYSKYSDLEEEFNRGDLTDIENEDSSDNNITINSSNSIEEELRSNPTVNKYLSSDFNWDSDDKVGYAPDYYADSSITFPVNSWEVDELEPIVTVGWFEGYKVVVEDLDNGYSIVAGFDTYQNSYKELWLLVPTNTIEA